MRTPTTLYGSVAIVTVSLLGACADPPTKPATLPLSSSFTGIAVVGPDSVAPGQSVQLFANLSQANGPVKTATSLPGLVWRSSNNSLMSVSPSGLVTASPSARGEAVITAEVTELPGVRGAREVAAQPEGTYRIVGVVHETGAPTFPIVGARVEVVPGSNATETDATGQYRLFGVPPDANIRITARGYETLDAPLALTANVTRNFELNLDGPRLSLDGAYTVSVDASPCNLASSLQRRSYDAVLTTTGTVIDVVLTEPRFRVNSSGRGNRFAGHLTDGGRATFLLEEYGWPDYQYPSIAENLTDNTVLTFHGFVTAIVTVNGLVGTLSGDMHHYDSQFPTNEGFPLSGWLGGCSAENIQFRITARAGGVQRR